MRRYTRGFFLVMLLLFAAVLWAPMGEGSSFAPPQHVPLVANAFPGMGTCIPATTPRAYGTTVGVVDGDTIDVAIQGQVERVRYIGMDTPERDEPYYDQATAANRALVAGKRLLLVRDVSDRDRYGRLLRYVVVGGVFVNYTLVREGWATAATYPPDVACSRTFVWAQKVARDEGRGIWKPTPTPTPSPAGKLEITEIQYAGRDEYVTIRNAGSVDQRMQGWTLVSVVGNQVYTFPDNYTLSAGGAVRVHSGPDAFEQWPTDLRWTGAYIWRNQGDKAELRDPGGRVVSSLCYGSGCP